MSPRYDAGKLGVFLVLSIFLQGCSPGEEADSADSVGPPISEETYSITVSGSVGDGPVVTATLYALSSTGELLSSSLGDSNATYSLDFQTKGKHYPIVIEATGGIDLVTQAPLDFPMRTLVLKPSNKATANVNPYTTLAYATARRMNGGLVHKNITNAMNNVLRQFNMGMTSAVSLDPLGTPIDDANLAELMRASEAVAEIFRRVAAAVAASGFPASKQSVIDSIAADLVDGVLDGRGTGGANRRIAATTKAVSAQIALETMRNELKVNGEVATARLDDVVLRLASGSSPDLTDSLLVTSHMIELAKSGVDAAIALGSTTALESVRNELDALRPGVTSATARQALPSDAGAVMLAPIMDIAGGTTADFNLLLPGSDDPVDLVNTPPAIIGMPAALAAEGALYEFVPIATDEDGDALTFGVENLPSWAVFDSTTGRLSGVPGAGDVGTYSRIRISVSDGRATASLPGFSINVTASSAPPPPPPPPSPTPPPNTAPTISGTPASLVLAGTPYVFAPAAGDEDGDGLTFTVANRPSWAAFDSTTGRLSGTPDAGDVGLYASIRINVSDGQATVSLPEFSIAVEAIALGTAMLSWESPTMNEDGSPLTNLAGFRVRWGQSSGVYTKSRTIMNPGISTYLIENLPNGTHYFVVTAINSAGIESIYSNEASKTLP